MKQINLQTFGDEKISLEEAREMCILHEGQVYKFFDEGTTRFVYANGNMTKVIKLNKNRIGKGMEALYITLEGNLEKYNDLGHYKDSAVLLEHKGVSEDNEVVYSIKK